jgi:hypothetical protein
MNGFEQAKLKSEAQAKKAQEAAKQHGYHLARYQARRSAGQCVKCKAPTTKAVCPDCALKAKMARCGVSPEPTAPGRNQAQETRKGDNR